MISRLLFRYFILVIFSLIGGGSAFAFAEAAKTLAATPRPIQIGGALKDSPAWEAYRTRFMSASGRIVDTGGGAMSHSEGQGYGMLLAVAAADRQSFDRIWSWTRANLHIREDRLAAWKWNAATQGAADGNNASDGDILIAWALAEAAAYWNDPEYLADARAITKNIVTKLLKASSSHGPILMPAVRGFSENDRRDGPVVNLSYWVFPAFGRLAQIEPNYDWRALSKTGLDLTDKARFGAARLPPDWLALGKTLAPAQGFEKRFGYDAMRIPLYLFWADAATPDRSRAFAEAWPAGSSISLVGLDRAAPAAAALTEPGYRAISALAHCSAANRSYPPDFYRFTESQNYYPATLHLLALVAARVQGGPCLDRLAMREIAPGAWAPNTESLVRLAATAPKPVRAKPIVKEEPAPAEEAEEGDPSPFDASSLESVDLVFYIRLIAAVVAIVSSLFWLLRRGSTESPEPLIDYKETAISSAVSAIQPAAAKDRYAVVPRTLPHSPFTPTTSLTALGEQIEVAASACVRLSRTVGLIYFEVPTLATIEKEHGAEAADSASAMLADTLRRSLRPTDHVAVLARDQIVACICLLANLTDLKSVAGRLVGVMQRQGVVSHVIPPTSPGFAIYPLDGYGGLDLIEAARRNYRQQIVEIEPMLPLLDPPPSSPGPGATQCHERRGALSSAA